MKQGQENRAAEILAGRTQGIVFGGFCDEHEIAIWHFEAAGGVLEDDAADRLKAQYGDTLAACIKSGHGRVGFTICRPWPLDRGPLMASIGQG